jgi:hypothetical protein
MRLTKRRKIRTHHGLQVDTYRLVSQAVEDGVTSGWYRAHKHTDTPTPEAIKCEIESAIMNELSNVFIWPDPYSGG